MKKLQIEAFSLSKWSFQRKEKLHWGRYRVFPSFLLKRLFLSHCVFLAPLSKTSWSYLCGFISGLSTLFHWSKGMFSCHNCTLLITIASQYNLKSENVMPRALFFLKIALAIQSPWWFHVNFRIIFSFSVKMPLELR